eukprot:UN19006
MRISYLFASCGEEISAHFLLQFASTAELILDTAK